MVLEIPVTALVLFSAFIFGSAVGLCRLCKEVEEHYKEHCKEHCKYLPEKILIFRGCVCFIATLKNKFYKFIKLIKIE